jgi:hypothetical protein
MRSFIVKAILVGTGLTLGGVELLAQTPDTHEKSSGIYITEDDFLKNNLSFYSVTDSQNRLDRVLDDVILMRAGKKFKLAKGSLYGYYQDGVRFRFYHDITQSLPLYGYYKILEDSSAVVYSRNTCTPKTGEHTWYYYSDTVGSPIKKLSARSLKNVPEPMYPLLLKYVLMKTGKTVLARAE